MPLGDLKDDDRMTFPNEEMNVNVNAERAASLILHQPLRFDIDRVWVGGCGAV